MYGEKKRNLKERNTEISVFIETLNAVDCRGYNALCSLRSASAFRGNSFHNGYCVFSAKYELGSIE
jgi:hypothetical protein